jgi:hypothetical protein
MTTFAEILPTLPPVDGISRIELVPQNSSEPAAVIENKPGQAGSLRVYHALLQRHGRIDADAAEEGLRLYAEHTIDARAHPGKHPNIDRLLQVIEQNLCYDVRVNRMV